jgi:hypothetical protein
VIAGQPWIDAVAIVMASKVFAMTTSMIRLGSVTPRSDVCASGVKRRLSLR